MTGRTQADESAEGGKNGDENDWNDVPHEGETWELNMRRAKNTTDEERRKDDRMYGDKFVRFTARVETVGTVLGGAAPVEMTVVRSNNHRNAPEVGGTVLKHTDIMAEYPEWERLGSQ